MRKIVTTGTVTILMATLIGCSSGQQKAPEAAGSNQLSAVPQQGGQSQASSPASSSQTSNSMADIAKRKRSSPTEPEAMAFKNYGINPFISTDEDHLSTFAADVDTGSYTVIRTYIKEGTLPPADAVRVPLPSMSTAARPRSAKAISWCESASKARRFPQKAASLHTWSLSYTYPARWIGETGAQGILRAIEDYARKEINLSTFGFGIGNYNDVLMEQLADKGEGNYAYIDSFSEARRGFPR